MRSLMNAKTYFLLGAKFLVRSRFCFVILSGVEESKNKRAPAQLRASSLGILETNFLK